VKAAQDHVKEQQHNQLDAQGEQVQEEQLQPGLHAAQQQGQEQGADTDAEQLVQPPDTSAFQGAVDVAQAALANKTLEGAAPAEPGTGASSTAAGSTGGASAGAGANWSGGGGGASRGVGPSIQPSPAGTIIMHHSRECGCDFMRTEALLSAAKAAAAVGGVSATSASALLVDAEEVVAAGEVGAEEVLGAWGEATPEQAPQVRGIWEGGGGVPAQSRCKHCTVLQPFICVAGFTNVACLRLSSAAMT
jgi:hypothetical protein